MIKNLNELNEIEVATRNKILKVETEIERKIIEHCLSHGIDRIQIFNEEDDVCENEYAIDYVCEDGMCTELVFAIVLEKQNIPLNNCEYSLSLDTGNGYNIPTGVLSDSRCEIVSPLTEIYESAIKIANIQ